MNQVIIIGPVFPHEVVGFSGGNSTSSRRGRPANPEFFSLAGAVVTNPMIIGNKWTPVRRVVDSAGAMVDVDKLCFCMVVDPTGTWRVCSPAAPRPPGMPQRSFAQYSYHLQRQTIPHHPLHAPADV